MGQGKNVPRRVPPPPSYLRRMFQANVGKKGNIAFVFALSFVEIKTRKDQSEKKTPTKVASDACTNSENKLTHRPFFQHLEPSWEQVDEEALRGLLRWHLDSGTDGIVALGTTGEASVLSTAERQLVLDITVEEVGGKMPVVAGTSSVNPVVVIEQSLHVCMYVCESSLPWWWERGVFKAFSRLRLDVVRASRQMRRRSCENVRPTT